MTIEVYKWADKYSRDYLVIIDDEAFEMDANSMPNGVNIYLGPKKDIAPAHMEKKMKMLPIGLVKNILQRCPTWES